MPTPQEYPILHFQQMKDLAIEIQKLPAQIEDHKYYYSSFGSWETKIRYKGKPISIVYDGKDHELLVQHSSNSISLEIEKPLESFPVLEIIEAIQRNGKFG